jgi:hypothetical protein
MKLQDEVLRNGRSLGDGPRGLDADIYGEEWPIGAALEKFVLEHWDDESEEVQE